MCDPITCSLVKAGWDMELITGFEIWKGCVRVRMVVDF